MVFLKHSFKNLDSSSAPTSYLKKDIEEIPSVSHLKSEGK
jgi:hypothetical protein